MEILSDSGWRTRRWISETVTLYVLFDSVRRPEICNYNYNTIFYFVLAIIRMQTIAILNPNPVIVELAIIIIHSVNRFIEFYRDPFFELHLPT